MKYIFYLLYLDKGRFIVHIHSDQSCGSRWKNQRLKRDLLCPWPIWLSCCGPWPRLLCVRHIKVCGCLDKHCESFSCAQMHSKKWNPGFFAEFRTAKNPTFQTHSSSSLSCLPPSVYSGIHQRHYCHARLISSREMKTSSHFKVQAKGYYI